MSGMDMLGAQLKAARARFAQLKAQVEARTPLEVVEEALTELSSSLEEIRVALEELQGQNEALAAARDGIELQQRRYQELFSLAPDAYLVTDLSGRIEEANGAAMELLGASARDLVGRPLAEFLPEVERGVLAGRLSHLSEHGRIDGWDLTLRMRDPDTVRYLSVDAVTGRDPVHRGPIIRWIVRDVTEKRRLLAQVREMDDKLWVRVVERTRTLTYENERLRAQLAAKERGGEGDGADHQVD